MQMTRIIALLFLILTFPAQAGDIKPYIDCYIPLTWQPVGGHFDLLPNPHIIHYHWSC